MEDHNLVYGKRPSHDDGNNVNGGLALTAGIGSKMLKNMGYKGGGLGKNEQGILNPIQPKPRPKNLGIGFDDGKKPKSDLPNSKRAVKKQPETVAVKNDWANWREKIAKKQRKDFCLAEFLAEKTTHEDEGFDDDDDDDGEVSLPNEMIVVLRRLRNLSSTGELTLEKLAAEFWDVYRRYIAFDCKWMHEFSRIVFQLAMPLFNEMFQDWDPLQDPRFGFEVVSLWKGLFRGEEIYYVKLFREIILPEEDERMSRLSRWQAEEPEPMLAFLEAWKELLPRYVVRDVLDKVVLPELKVAIQLWKPNVGSVPIHQFVHPWLPVLLDLEREYHLVLEELLETMRLKLCYLLISWHPRDEYGYDIVSPWKSVYDSTTWEMLMVGYVVPKLQRVLLEDFEVNPAEQKLDQFNWVMRWASTIPMHLMVNMMLKCFFPEWIEGLNLWLETKPSFEDVANWYREWKQLIPKEFHANQSIRRQLEYALQIMNQAVERMEVAQPGMEENSEGPTNMDDIDHEMNIKDKGKIDEVEFKAKKRVTNFLTNAKLGRRAVVDDINHQMTLKDVIEAVSQEHGLLFRLKPGRMYNGHQVYGFGKVSIMVDCRKEKIYAQTEETWSLVSLTKLLEMHRIREVMSSRKRPRHS